MMQGGTSPMALCSGSDKIEPQHRERTAIVYVRQSTLQQVERHQESTRLQYALVDRAFQFAWARGESRSLKTTWVVRAPRLRGGRASSSEGALDAMFRRAKPAFDDAVVAILGRLRRSRIVCSDDTSVRIDGKTCWNWVFQNEQVVIHVIRKTRGAVVVAEVMDGHRPVIWVSDLYGAQQGHADRWQICLAHQLRDCQFAIDAGDTVFAPRMKALLLRAVILARRRKTLAESTRREYRRRLDKDLNAIMALVPENPHGKRLRKRYGKVRNDLFTFLIHPDAPPDNNGSERELRPPATYRKVTGGFRSDWGADLFAGIRSVVGTAARNGIDAYTATRNTLSGNTLLNPG